MRAQKTTITKPSEIKEKWYLVDAEGQVLGRLATRVAQLVRGKNNPDYSPHQNPNIHVIVTNADKVILTGSKLNDKVYYHHSGWRTGIKSINAAQQLEKHPERVLQAAIHGMLPKNTLGRKLNTNVRIYKSGQYTNQHEAQQPEKLDIQTRKPKEEE